MSDFDFSELHRSLEQAVGPNDPCSTDQERIQHKHVLEEIRERDAKAAQRLRSEQRLEMVRQVFSRRRN